MDAKSTRALVAASVAGLVMAGVAGTASAEHHEHVADGGKVACYGINKCKGTGACGGKGHSCAGANACQGQGYLELDQETCLKIQGGRLTPDAEAS